jgi:hypothetical protein
VKQEGVNRDWYRWMADEQFVDERDVGPILDELNLGERYAFVGNCLSLGDEEKLLFVLISRGYDLFRWT